MSHTTHALNKDQLNQLQESLYFLHVEELKSLAHQLHLSEKGKKLELIQRIITFIETGKKIECAQFPRVSCAPRGMQVTLKPDARMLKGNYKNDLATRLFFKKLIGSHFHFTAFGIDWLNEQWMQGKPPTYQDFADMWQSEYERRLKNPAAAKTEWAYINFVQNLAEKHPELGREMVHAAWHVEREKHKTRILSLLHSFLPVPQH
jgi:hypothetical protein